MRSGMWLICATWLYLTPCISKAIGTNLRAMQEERPELDLVSLAEIANRLGVPPGTVYAWRKRNRLPEPDWTVSESTPVWRWQTIQRWAVGAGYITAPAEDAGGRGVFSAAAHGRARSLRASQDADQLVRDLLSQGSEFFVDYKTAMPLPSDPRGRARLAKQIMGFANRHDGGYLLVGVDDKTHQPVGLTAQQINSWDAPKLKAAVELFARPVPVMQVLRGSTEAGEALVAIHVAEFHDQPVLCVSSIDDDKGRPVVRAGALYIRTASTETKEITTEAEMRELLDRAYLTKGDRVLASIKALIDAHWPAAAPETRGTPFADSDLDLEDMKLP